MGALCDILTIVCFFRMMYEIIFDKQINKIVLNIGNSVDLLYGHFRSGQPQR